MSATGVMMFFEWNVGLTTVVHQWFSWTFLIGASAHIASNVRAFKSRLRSSWGRFSVAAFALVLAASFFSWGLVTGPQIERPVEAALLDAPLSALAGVARTSPDALLLRLKDHGVTATGQQSVHQVSQVDGIGENRLLAIVFPDQPSGG